MRWDIKKAKNVERPDVDKFIEEIIAVYREHKMSISHEDGHGLFIVEAFNEENTKWLREAMVQ